jgi:SRSO17 transposase
VLGHADRQLPALLMRIERKSVGLMTAVAAPAQAANTLLHFVGNAPWSDAAMLAKVSELVRAEEVDARTFSAACYRPPGLR